MQEEITQEVIDFIGQLTELSKQLGEVYKSGNIGLLSNMNRTIKELYRIQHGSENKTLQEIDEECKVIYGNFDMLVAVLKTTENGEIDKGAQSAVGKFLHNINEAVVNIAAMFGLV